MPRSPRGAEVVVVDNASHDGTIAEVARRGVRLIANSDNRGFAAAVNQGFCALNCPYILLLNPDADPADQPRTAARSLPASERGRRGRKTGGRAAEIRRPDSWSGASPRPPL